MRKSSFKKEMNLAPFYFIKRLKLSPREGYRTEEVPVSSSSHDAFVVSGVHMLTCATILHREIPIK